MKQKVILYSVLILALTISSFAQPAPEAGKRWIVVPELTDEFEGTVLNTEKWTTNHNAHPVLIWPGRQPAVFHPDKVKVDSGKITIEVGKLPNPIQVYKYGRYITYEYYGGCIRGFTPVRAGQYYECEAKMNRTEMGGGFWMAAPHSCGKVREIDITESVGIITDQTAGWARDWDHIMHSNGFYTRPDCSETTQTSNKINLPTKNYEKFYRYGFWWKGQGELLFYVNGEYVYSIKLPDDSDRELYLQYDIEAYDWNPFPADGGRVTHGSLEERTTHLNYIHTFKLVDADDPGIQGSEVFDIYREELMLDSTLTVLTTGSTLSIPLTYKANEDREIHLKLFNSQDELVGEDLVSAYAGYSNQVYEIDLGSVPAAGAGYTLYADIRPVHSPDTDTIMSDNIGLELLEPSVLTIQVLDEETNDPLQDVSVSLNDSIKLTDANGMAVFHNVPVTEYFLELEKYGYDAIRVEDLQILNDSLMIKHMSPERFSLFYSFVDYSTYAPITNARVSINDSSQNTGASGKVLFNVKRGRYGLSLVHSNYLLSDSIDVSQNSNEVFRLIKAYGDFYVFVKIDNKAYADIMVTFGDSTRITDSDGRIIFPLLKIDSTYRYRVVRDSEILKEGSVLITENGTLNINISALRSKAGSADLPSIIYPNPASDRLHFPGTNKKVSYKVFKLSGAEVMNGQTSRNSISIKSLSNGIYLLELEEYGIIRFLKE